MSAKRAHALADRPPQMGQIRDAGGFVLLDDDGAEVRAEVFKQPRRHGTEIYHGVYVSGGTPPVLKRKDVIVRPRVPRSVCLVGQGPYVRPELMRHHRITPDQMGYHLGRKLVLWGVVGVLCSVFMAVSNLQGMWR